MPQSSPRISVVVAAYNVENFIGTALQSALDQTVAFDEVIVVNDASTDTTGVIIERLAMGHAQVKILHNAQNVGLGQVRNIGMDAATGDYVCFLDGDDYFLPEAASRLKEAVSEMPDVVLYNYARFYSNGNAKPNVMSHLLTSGVCRTVSARKALFGNLNVAWNKLYSRKFLTRSGLRFPSGKYEDIGWNYMSLMLAKEIVTTPDILLHYRQRDGSILNTRNMTHFELFDRWAELFTQVSEYPDLLRDYGDLLKVRRFKSLTFVLDHQGRLPQYAKRRFAARIRQVCGPVQALPKGHISRLERVLDLPGGAYLRPYLRSKIMRRMLTMARIFARWLKRQRHAHKIFLYRSVFLRLPMDPNLVVYQSYWGKKIACNPYAIYTFLREERPQIAHAWVVNDDADLRDTADNSIHLSERSLRYYYIMARAGVLINNANFPDEIIKRQGSVHVQTKHGTPLKYMGLDQLRVDPKAFVDPNAFAARCARWDYVISANSYSTDIWRQSFPYNYKVIETGYPRNDRLITATDNDRSQVRAKLGLPAEAEVVLYAPTFRDNGASQDSSALEKDKILLAILDGLGAGQVLALRDHYILTPDSVVINDPRLFDLTSAISTTDVLLATDVLITDYSSIMFDYAVRQKPIVVFGYDLKHYEEVRGVYFDINQDHSGVFCDTLSALTLALANRVYDTESAQAMQDAFHARFCHVDDGQAAKKVCQIIFSSVEGG